MRAGIRTIVLDGSGAAIGCYFVRRGKLNIQLLYVLQWARETISFRANSVSSRHWFVAEFDVSATTFLRAWVQGMDSFEFNKIAGAVLGTALVVFGLREMAGIIYHADAPEKPGIIIEVAEAATDAKAAGEEQAEAAVPIATLLASANPENGPNAMKACKACHTWDKGGANKVGPNLWDIVGRNMGAVDGFKYSSTIKDKSADPWTYEALDAFLKKPKVYMPGTKMAYAGIKSDAKRADLIAYLRTLSDSPQPLPSE